MQFDHLILIDWINLKFLKIKTHYSKRFTCEARFINSDRHAMNRSDGNNLLQVYHCLITS